MKIAIVIVTYNSADSLAACIESLATVNFPHDVYVVDNCSEDSTIDVAHLYKAKVVVNTENLGYSKAINKAVSMLPDEYTHILVLNPDVIISNVDFSDLISYCQRNIVSVRMNNAAGVRRLNSYFFPTIFNTLLVRYRFHEPVSSISNVDCVEGSFMFFSRQVFDAVGGFDPEIFLYGEDYEFCYRAYLKGYSCLLLTDYSYIHEGGFNDSRVVFIYRGLEYFFKKHKPYWQYLWIKNLLQLKKIVKGV
jgi:GT2 family glycosyltransferase